MSDFIKTETLEELNLVLSQLKKDLPSPVIKSLLVKKLNKISVSDFGEKYSDLPNIFTDIVSNSPFENTNKTKYFILIFLALNFKRDFTLFKIPDDFSDLYNRYFKKICLRAKNLDPIVSCGDTFEKDVSICLGKSVLVGARIICENGFSRTLLIKGGFKQFIDILKVLIKLRLKNIGFEMHTHLGYLDEFSADGWHDTLIRCQQFLVKNKHDLLFVCSWIYDPNLYVISPNLKYHVEDGVVFGAIHARWGEVGPKCGALSKSKKRKKLYDEGKYTPEAYCLIWHKSKMFIPQKSNHE